MIFDYYIVRKRELSVEDLYRRGGVYEYRSGFNGRAVLALAGEAADGEGGGLRDLGGKVVMRAPITATVIERKVTLLPDPDSPTRPSTSPTASS